MLTDDDDDNSKQVDFIDVKYSDQLYNTLKTTNYIDTVNKIFADNNNTLVLEGKIKKLHTFIVYYGS